MKGAMMLVFHTAGVPYKPSGKGSCLDPYFTKVGALWRAFVFSIHSEPWL